MFWTFNSQISQIHTILEQEDCTLQKILSEDDVLQECKVGNKALIEYLLKPDHMKQMVAYLINGSPEDNDEATKYKFANICCEILTSGNNNLTDSLIGRHVELSASNDDSQETSGDISAKENEEVSTDNQTFDDTYLDCLYSFLLQTPPVIPLLASFFTKVMTFLLGCRAKRIVSYLQSKSNFVELVIVHLESSAISDFLIKLICVENKEMRAVVAEWMTKEKLIYRLVEGMNPAECDEKHVYISHCLSELISQIRELSAQENEEDTAADSSMVINNSSPESPPESTAILDTLESAEIMEQLVLNLVMNNKASIIVNTAYIFQTILDNKTKEMNCLSDLNPNLVSIRIDPQRVALATSNLIEACIPHISALVAILENPPDQFFSNMLTTHGILSPPFGNSRLQIVRLIQSLIESQVYKIHNALYHEKIFHKLFTLFYDYPFNTFLHKAVVDQVIFVVSHIPPKPSSSSSPLRNEEAGPINTETIDDHVEQSLLKQVIIECNVIDKIPQWWRENEEKRNVPGQFYRGYSGHLSRMANCIVDCFKISETKALIDTLYNELDESVRQEWENFVTETLEKINANSAIDSSVLTSLNNSIEQDEDFHKESFFAINSKLEEFPISNNSKVDDLSLHSRINFSGGTFGGFLHNEFNPANFDDDDDYNSSSDQKFSHFMQLRNAKNSALPDREEDEEEEEDDEEEDEDDLPSPVVIRQSHDKREARKDKSLTPQDDILCQPPSLEPWGEEKANIDSFDVKEDLDDEDYAFDSIASDRVRPMDDNNDAWTSDEILLDDCKDFPADFSTSRNENRTNSSSASHSKDDNWANFDAFSGGAENQADFCVATGNGDSWVATFDDKTRSKQSTTSEEGSQNWPGSAT